MADDLTLDEAIERTEKRISEHERLIESLVPYPNRHRQAVEILLLFRDCLFELEETRRILGRGEAVSTNNFS